MGDTDDKFCTIYIIVTILLNHYLLRGGYVSNSSLYNVGSVGYYWSSTPYSSNNAYILLFSSNTITAVYTGRDLGYSVRCVAAG